VQASTGRQVQTGARARGWGYPPWRSYGYFWWRYPLPGAFMAVGRGGQFIIVWPKLDLIVVTTAVVQDGDWDLRSLVERYIVPAVRQS
jgi:CubicO group peptidase (beta-lactamase class C family)